MALKVIWWADLRGQAILPPGSRATSRPIIYSLVRRASVDTFSLPSLLPLVLLPSITRLATLFRCYVIATEQDAPIVNWQLLLYIAQLLRYEIIARSGLQSSYLFICTIILVIFLNTNICSLSLSPMFLTHNFYDVRSKNWYFSIYLVASIASTQRDANLL